jgi:hypothetical protein
MRKIKSNFFIPLDGVVLSSCTLHPFGSPWQTSRT